MLTVDFSVFPKLETQRLLLRQLKIEDAEEVFFLRSDERVLQFIRKEPAQNLNEAKDFINRVNNEYKNGDTILWGIAFKENPEKIIGTICLWRISKQNYLAELGYLLHPYYWRKGIVKEAILKVLEYGFNEMMLHRVEARTSSENIPSIAILEASGFVKEGHLKEDTFFRGRFYDSFIFSRLTNIK